MNLKFCINTAMDLNVLDHPQRVMSELGISYIHSTPQSIADQWWFWGCKNVPEVLPDYLSEFNLNPRKAVGWGLSKEDAEKILEVMK